MKAKTLLLASLAAFSCSDADTSLPAVSAGSNEPIVHQSEENLLQWVDPFIGTGGVGFAYAGMTPAVQTPFGFVKLGPDTTTNNSHPSAAHHFSGYYDADPQIRGFSHLHFVGTGAADYGNLRALPTTRANLDSKPNGFAYEAFDKETETAAPGYYSATLTDSGTHVELTSSRLVGVHRYTFSNLDNVVSFDVTSSVQDSGAQDATLNIEGHEFWGEVSFRGSLTGRNGPFTLFFFGQFSSIPDRTETWIDDTLSEATTASGDDIGAWFSFTNTKTVGLKVGVSFISIDNARTSVESQPNFEETRKAAEAEWSEILDRVQIEGDETHKKIFYTALYNTYRMPTRVDENGEYRAVDGTVQPTSGPHLTDLSLWDTFRTLHPWYTLFDPRAQRWTLNSLLRTAKIGGMMPRWPAATNYSGAMEGTSADILFAESALKGIVGVDYDAAFEIARKTATESQDGIAFGGREGIVDYMELGWIPADEFSNPASNTMEYSLNDAALANLASFLGRDEDREYFEARSKSYQSLWDDESKFLRPRNRDGSFVEPFDPKEYSERSGLYTEGSAWHWLFYAPHDPEGLAELSGGAATFVDRLETFMSSAELFKENPRLIFPDPFYWHTNQPSLHVPAMFAAVGRRDLGSQWIRKIQTAAYTTETDGIIGNDDGGTLSAWYLLTAIGLYPQVGTDRYYVNAPLFESVRIKLQNGETLTVTGGAVDRHEISDATIDGEPLGDVVTHSELGGARLQYVLE